MISELALYCNYLLLNYPGAKSHLDYIQSRISIDSINKYKIGYFPKLDDLNLLLDVFSRKFLLENKILYESYNVGDFLFFENCISIPYYDLYNECIGFSCRYISKYTSKYKNSFFQKNIHLFNLNNASRHIIKSNYVIITEGQLDSIKGSEVGINNIISTCGSKISPIQMHLISRYTNNIFLLFDNDEAGNKFRNKIKEDYSFAFKFKDIYIPEEFKDINEYLLESDYDLNIFK